MTTITAFKPLPGGYHTDVTKYYEEDAKKISADKTQEVQNEIDKIKGILEDNIDAAADNITKLNGSLTGLYAKEKTIREELEAVKDIIKKHSSDINGDKPGTILSQDEVALLKKYGITDLNAPSLENVASKTANKLISEVVAERADVRKEIDNQRNALKEFNDQLNIQLNRIKTAKSTVLQDALSYGMAMALSLFQLKCAKNSNDDAYVKLQEVKLAQGKSGDIAAALEAARNLKNLINSGIKKDDAKLTSAVKDFEDAITAVNKAVETDKITHSDGGKLTAEQKKKMTVFETITIATPSISIDGEDKKKNALSSIEDVVSSLSSWQTTYANKVNTIMTELNDASSKYSNFVSGSNQSLQKSTDILSKMVGLYV